MKQTPPVYLDGSTVTGPTVQFRIRPEKRAGCACKSDDAQFEWSDYTIKPKKKGYPVLHLAKSVGAAEAKELARVKPLNLTPLFEYRYAP